STFFKQFANLHAGGFQQRDRKSFRDQIYEQLIDTMKLMITKCEEYFEEDTTANQKFELGQSSQTSADVILATRNNSPMTSELAKHLDALWKDPAIQQAFKIRNKICVPDSTGFFLDKLSTVTQEDYVPSDERKKRGREKENFFLNLFLNFISFLYKKKRKGEGEKHQKKKFRYRTTGMAEKEFEVEKTKLKVVDVGGQRNERRKWIHFFDSVTAVLFVASLSAYNEATFEDEDLNAMEDSLQIFEEHVNSEWFQNTAFILFLNKSDVFRQRIKETPITVCFKEYTGRQDYEECYEYIYIYVYIYLYIYIFNFVCACVLFNVCVCVVFFLVFVPLLLCSCLCW
ncbi:guanine nucleotide binding protein, partial [Reticulomyxa filosa]